MALYVNHILIGILYASLRILKIKFGKIDEVQWQS